MGQYIYVLEAVEPEKAAGKVPMTPEDEESFRLHWTRLEQARDDRTLILAGRSQDADAAGPAIVIFEAGSDAEAQRFVAAEPFVLRGFARATVYPFKVAISRNKP
jgi:uncharacterized protein YciI